MQHASPYMRSHNARADSACREPATPKPKQKKKKKKNFGGASRAGHGRERTTPPSRGVCGFWRGARERFTVAVNLLISNSCARDGSKECRKGTNDVRQQVASHHPRAKNNKKKRAVLKTDANERVQREQLTLCQATRAN